MKKFVKVKKRTNAEIKAYADGYNDAYKAFCECLKDQTPDRAIAQVGVYVKLINSQVGKEQ